MKYFAKITSDHWTLKNKVNEDARKVAEFMDRMLINTEQDRKRYIDILQEGIKTANEKHPRCTPLKLEVYGKAIGPLRANEDCFAIIPGNFHITIYVVKE